MTLRWWACRLLASPATYPPRKAPARCGSASEAIKDRNPTTITCKPAEGTARQHQGLSALSEQAVGGLVYPGRLSPVTIGFWLGGAGMGTGGCLLGALMPYHHPVAVTISVLWWGLYFGCFGAGVGALVGVLTDRAPPRPSATWDGAGMVPRELELDSRAADATSTAVRARGGHPPRSPEIGGSSCKWS
jgi:hypothetical protein